MWCRILLMCVLMKGVQIRPSSFFFTSKCWIWKKGCSKASILWIINLAIDKRDSQGRYRNMGIVFFFLILWWEHGFEECLLEICILHKCLSQKIWKTTMKLKKILKLFNQFLLYLIIIDLKCGKIIINCMSIMFLKIILEWFL